MTQEAPKPRWIKYTVKLTEEERSNLQRITTTGKSAAKKIIRARILLHADESLDNKRLNNTDIAKILDIKENHVIKTRKRFVEEGLELAINRKPLSRTKPRKLDGEGEARLIAIACDNPPEGRARWTLKLLANKLVELKVVESIGATAVGTTLKKNELKPWLKKEWCIPPKNNAAFVCNMEDVLDVYKRPYDEKMPVVCMDESSKQLTKETRTSIPATVGVPAKYDTEYERNGTSNIFVSCEPLKGQRTVKVTEHRKRTDWAYFMKGVIDDDYSNAEKIVLVVDNLNTHTKSSFYEAFEPVEAKRLADKLEIHYTPKHGSWLNVAEIELSHLNRQCLDRRIEDQETLIKEIAAWNRQRNEESGIVDWQFTTADARIKLKKLYPAIK